MRIVCTSDWHGDWSTLGHRRHAEVTAAVEQSVELAIAEQADAYLFLGDATDPDTGGDTFHTIALMIRTALRLRDAGIKSIWIRGNHDVCEDGTNGCTLTALKALERGLDIVSFIYVALEPRVVWLSDDVAILALPFMPMSHGIDMEMAALALFPAEPLPSGKLPSVVVAGHLMLPGVHPGSETTEMPRGREVLFPALQTTKAALRLNGHYHARQIHDPGDGGPGIYIPGSLARLTFGEEGNQPSILVVDVPTLAP